MLPIENVVFHWLLVHVGVDVGLCSKYWCTLQSSILTQWQNHWKTHSHFLDSNKWTKPFYPHYFHYWLTGQHFTFRSCATYCWHMLTEYAIIYVNIAQEAIVKLQLKHYFMQWNKGIMMSQFPFKVFKCIVTTVSDRVASFNYLKTVWLQLEIFLQFQKVLLKLIFS